MRRPSAATWAALADRALRASGPPQLSTTMAPNFFRIAPTSGNFSRWSPVTKLKLSTLANITKPSPQLWCLAAMMKGPLGRFSWPFSCTFTSVKNDSAHSIRWL